MLGKGKGWGGGGGGALNQKMVRFLVGMGEGDFGPTFPARFKIFFFFFCFGRIQVEQRATVTSVRLATEHPDMDSDL